MPFSNDLTNALNNILDNNSNIKEIDEKAKEISKKYRANNNDGKRLVTKTNEAIAYALSRMPATYESVASCMKRIFEENTFKIDTILDVGAGTGTATWAIYDMLGNKEFSCFERENEMINVGKKLMKYSSISKNVKWKKFDILENNIDGKYDLVVVSYMINELPKDQIELTIKKLWNATKEVLLILEPGTPNGFSNILKIRKLLLEQNAYIIAPCTHQNECQISNDDWCQFSQRVQRSKIHKKLKSGSSPYEDEKFSYIAFSRAICKRAENRILRHPIVNKGFSEYKICSSDTIKNVKLSKKDGNIYKEAKKKSAGDSLNLK